MFISFVTYTELHYGSQWAQWGAPRLQRLAAHLNRARIVWPDPDLAQHHARLRANCRRIGHALHDQRHDADRWIAATATWLDIPLVTADEIFADTPGLTVLTAP